MEEVNRTNKKYDLTNIRALELRFDKIVKNANAYTLIENGLEIATVSRDCLNDATRTKLDSLAEFRI